MRTPTKQIVAIALVGVMIAAAGCAGWGTDDPADNESDGSDTGDDLEDEQNQSQSDGSSSSDSDSSSDTGDSSDASSGDSDGDSASDNPAPDSDTGSSDDSDRSDGDTSNGDSDTDNGPDGTDGSDSDDSSDESDGDDGSDGSDGSDGDDGDNGTDGDDGNDTDEIGAALSVTVEDQDGNTVEGIEVVGIGPDAEIYSADTNADGRATYDDLPAGDYEFHATTDGTDYEESTTESISLDDGDDESLTVTVTDTDAGTEPGASLTVTVEDQAGSAVEGVEVIGIGPDAEIYSAETNADGQASYDSLPAGDYEYHVTTDGTDYEESSTEAISLADGDDESLTVTVTDTDTGTEPGASLTVTVEDQDGNAVEGIEVVGIGPDAEIYSADTNADGQASYDDLPAGDYEFHATTSDDYPESSTESITLADGDNKSLTVTVSDTDGGGSETSALNVTVDNHNGDPVEGASVSVLERPSGDEVATGTTDSNGAVTLDVPDGEYDIVAEHDEANEPIAGLVTVDGDTETSLTLDTSEGLATGVVRVVDQNGDPVEEEEVTLWPPGTVEEEATETRETDANGEVRIELGAGEPEDVVMFDVEVRDQEQTLGIMADAYQGVQEVTFEVDTAKNGENETGDVNETSATVALA